MSKWGVTLGALVWVLGDGYRLEQPVGEGSSAMVFTARDPEGARVAIKVGRSIEARGLEKLSHEAEVMRSLAAHPSVLPLLAQGVLDAPLCGLPPGAPWLASPFHAGGTLTAWCRREAVTWSMVGGILRQVLCGLTHVHARGWLHLDLKPSNVFLGDDSGHPRAVLGDLGIARRRDTRPRQKTTSGTPAYMAPERFSGDWDRTGPATDLYALGAVSWRLVTGSRPLRASTLDEWRVVHEALMPAAFVPRFGVPEGLEDWLRRLLAKDPSDRYSEAPAALCALDALSGVEGELGMAGEQGTSTDGPGATLVAA